MNNKKFWIVIAEKNYLAASKLYESLEKAKNIARKETTESHVNHLILELTGRCMATTKTEYQEIKNDASKN